MHLPFRGDQSVAAEIAIVYFFSEISAERIKFSSVLIVADDSLIDPIPDEPSLKFRLVPEKLPILVKGTVTVSHCSTIFNQNQRAI